MVGRPQVVVTCTLDVFLHESVHNQPLMPMTELQLKNHNCPVVTAVTGLQIDVVELIAAHVEYGVMSQAPRCLLVVPA
jgi:hypothetical protein